MLMLHRLIVYVMQTQHDNLLIQLSTDNLLARMRVIIYACACICMYACMCVCMQACVHASLCAHKCMCVHKVHVHAQSACGCIRVLVQLHVCACEAYKSIEKP